MKGCLGLLVICCLTAGGCGGSGAGAGAGDGGLPRAELARRADAICRRANADTEKITRPVSFAEPKQAARYFAAAVPPAERQQRELEALRPERDVRATWDGFVADERKAVELLRELRDVARSGDADGVVTRLGRLAPLDKAVSARADPLGARACGSAG